MLAKVFSTLWLPFNSLIMAFDAEKFSILIQFNERIYFACALGVITKESWPNKYIAEISPHFFQEFYNLSSSN